ncbi:MAG: H/ACA ribonucleoprotein complex subunit GAR1 [Candidatus Hodarchaeales archaeon]
MPQIPSAIGRYSLSSQGKIIVRLEGKNLPKIGSQAQVKRHGRYQTIGRIVEAIGSTRAPWIVIVPKKKKMTEIGEGEMIFASNEPPKQNKRKKKKKYKYKKRN